MSQSLFCLSNSNHPKKKPISFKSLPWFKHGDRLGIQKAIIYEGIILHPHANTTQPSLIEDYGQSSTHSV